MQETKAARGRWELVLAQGRPLEAGASSRAAPAPRAPTSDLRAPGSPGRSLPCSALSPDVSPTSSRSGRTHWGSVVAVRLLHRYPGAKGRRRPEESTSRPRESAADQTFPSPTPPPPTVGDMRTPGHTRTCRLHTLNAWSTGASKPALTCARAHSGRHTALSVRGSILLLVSPQRVHHQDGWCATLAGNRTVSPRS